MNDITDKLRRNNNFSDRTEAADEIEKLRREIKRLQIIEAHVVDYLSKVNEIKDVP